MSDDLSSAVSEASNKLAEERAALAKNTHRPKGQRGKIRPFLLLGALVAIWVLFGQEAIERSGLIGKSEVEIAINQVLGEVAASVNDYYDTRGALPETPPHGYLEYAVNYQVTGAKSYALSYEMDGVAITHSYRVQ
jgi:hypothetical protein